MSSLIVVVAELNITPFGAKTSIRREPNFVKYRQDNRGSSLERVDETQLDEWQQRAYRDVQWEYPTSNFEYCGLAAGLLRAEGGSVQRLEVVLKEKPIPF